MLNAKDAARGGAVCCRGAPLWVMGVLASPFLPPPSLTASMRTLSHPRPPFSSILSFGPFFSTSLHFSDEPLKWPIYHLTNQHNGIDWRSPRRPCPRVASPEGLRENDLQLPNTESSHLLNITKRMKHSGASGIHSSKASWLFPFLKVYECKIIKDIKDRKGDKFTWAKPSHTFIKMLLRARKSPGSTLLVGP